MTPERTVEAFEACRQAISAACPEASSQQLPEVAKASKCDRSPFWGSVPLASHLLYMCDTGKQFVWAGRTEKAMRWLGFLQGAIWAYGIASIDEMKHWNMPKE